MSDLTVKEICNYLRSMAADENDSANYAADLIEKQQKRITEIKSERDALAAHIERYDKSVLDAIPFLPGGEIKANLRDVYDDSPQTSLALHEENERLREALVKSQDWDWISAREDNEVCGRDYFEIPEMQELYEITRENESNDE